MKKIALGFILSLMLTQAHAYNLFRIGEEVVICAHGSDKPVGVVLMETDSRVKLEIIKGGGNMFVHYSTGEVIWLEKRHVGC